MSQLLERRADKQSYIGTTKNRKYQRWRYISGCISIPTENIYLHAKYHHPRTINNKDFRGQNICANNSTLYYMIEIRWRTKPEVGGFGIYLMMYKHILIVTVYLHANYHIHSAIDKDFRHPYVMHK